MPHTLPIPPSLPLYIYIYTFFCFFIYKGGKTNAFLRVTEVTGFLEISKTCYKLAINGSFLPFFTVTTQKRGAKLSFSTN